MDVLNRNQAVRAAASRLTGMDGVGAAAARAAFSGPTSIGAAHTLAARSGFQAVTRAIAERNGRALTSALNQSQTVRDASA